MYHGALQEQGRLHLPLDTRLIQPQEKSAICDKQYVEEVNVKPEAGISASGYVFYTARFKMSILSAHQSFNA